METAQPDMLVQILLSLLELSRNYPVGSRFLAGVVLWTLAIGAASMLVEHLVALTKIKPDTADHELDSHGGRLARLLVRILSVIARNPK